ncbi:MAG TPA: DUF4339 domain-containing protein [Kiritimatiellia bacterium]|nr:DUF4339 domain-containing protein [Kiritimatiellia bacterium]
MANWYYVNPQTRDKSGPHEEAFVRTKFIAGELAPSALVWHDGLAHWIPASEAFAALQSPTGTEGRVSLPDGLRGWMTFVGIMTILSAILPSLMLYGLPILLAGIALLGARAALDRAPFVAPDMIPFFAKLKTFFCCWGWMYIIGIFLTILLLLIYVALSFWAVSSDPAQLPRFFTP